MTQDELKRAVAQAALDYVLPQLTADSIVGIGTGSTANFFIDLLASHKAQFRATVASSSASTLRLQQHGIEVLDLNLVDTMAFYIDGADEINADLAMIKGGGAALTQEKIVAAVAQKFVCIADQSKWVNTLGRFPLPVEVIPMARSYVARQLTQLGGRPVYRKQASEPGMNLITDNGGNILDVYDLQITEPKELEQAINQITGVVCNGLFAQRSADVLFLAKSDGVAMISKP